MEIKGTIIKIGETQTIGDGSFRKREVVVKTNEQYPQQILVQFVQDKCDVLNGYNVNDMVAIGVNLRGREWTSPQGEVKYFNTIQGWRITRIHQAEVVTKTSNDSSDESATTDDLPF